MLLCYCELAFSTKEQLEGGCPRDPPSRGPRPQGLPGVTLPSWWRFEGTRCPEPGGGDAHSPSFASLGGAHEDAAGGGGAQSRERLRAERSVLTLGRSVAQPSLLSPGSSLDLPPPPFFPLFFLFLMYLFLLLKIFKESNFLGGVRRKVHF